MALEDVVAPALADALTPYIERVIDAGIEAFRVKIIPIAKAKGGEFISRVNLSQSERKHRKGLQKQSVYVIDKPVVVETILQKEADGHQLICYVDGETVPIRAYGVDDDLTATQLFE